MIQPKAFRHSQKSTWLFILCLSLVSAPGAFAGLSPAQAEVPRLVNEAAAFKPGDSREAFARIEELVRQSIADSALRESLEAGLIKLLGPASTFEARRFACKELGIIGGKAALPAIAVLLKGDDTASIACLALTTYPPGRADEVLRTALASAQGNARIVIIDTLGDRRDTRSVEALSRLAKSSDTATARAAIAALGKIGDQAADEALVSLGKSASATLSGVFTEAELRCAAGLAAAGDRKAAVKAYEKLLIASNPVYVRRAAFVGLMGLDKDDGEMRILQTLHGGDVVLKPVAIGAVRALSSKEASAKFGAQIPSLQPQEQVWMIESLTVRGDVPARNAIASSLSSKDPAVRRAAIGALSQMGDASTVGLLARTLADSSDTEERRAIEAALIALHGGAPIDQAVIVELQQSSGDARASLIGVLAKRQGTAANIVLFDETTNADPVIAKAAFRALASTAAAGDVSTLLRKVISTRDPEVRAEALAAVAQALGKIDDPGDRSSLVRESLRTAPSVEIVSSLLTLLPRCGDGPALAILQAAQADPNPQVRDSAVRALAEWPNDAAWDALVSIYSRPANETVRKLALHGVVRLINEENPHPDAKLMARYRELLDWTRDDGDYRLILGALGSAASPDALQIALPLLDKQSVRPEAEAAVKKIAQSIKTKHPDAAASALAKLNQKPQ